MRGHVIIVRQKVNHLSGKRSEHKGMLPLANHFCIGRPSAKRIHSSSAEADMKIDRHLWKNCYNDRDDDVAWCTWGCCGRWQKPVEGRCGLRNLRPEPEELSPAWCWKKMLGWWSTKRAQFDWLIDGLVGCLAILLTGWCILPGTPDNEQMMCICGC